MAIRNISTQGSGESARIQLEIDNGDLQALRAVMAKFGFVDEQALFRFALFVLLSAPTNVLYTDSIEGGDKKTAYRPAEAQTR